MQEHQRRILGRVMDEIAWYRDGRRSMLELLNNAWGLFEAAELRDPDERNRFLDAYYALSNADDANQLWTARVGSEQEVQSALNLFEHWAREVLDQGSDDRWDEG